MRNLLFGLAAIGLLASTAGCANGPIRQWFRGAPCNTCNPHVGQPLGENFAGDCASGNCANGTTGSGFLGSMFRPNGNIANLAPASIPATSFDRAPAGFVDESVNADIYGNTGNSGNLESPPIGPYNLP